MREEKNSSAMDVLTVIKIRDPCVTLMTHDYENVFVRDPIEALACPL